ncbi:MAG: CHC2 zinc finger domain-containing protein [Thermoanaerobaculia bacterium]
MARIPDAELEQLKRQVSVERLAEARGVELKRHGKDLLGLCPFHDDHEPSLVISPEKNLWHCLGACRQGGSVIDWVMKAEGVSFRHAVELLRKDFSLAAVSRGKPPKHSSVPKLPLPVELEAEEAERLAQVVGYYHETLKESPEALDYLRSRGLEDPELIDRFQLGYANRTLGYRLPSRDGKAGQELRQRLQRIGILRQSGHEHFNGSLVIPVFDREGRVVEVYGRKIRRDLRKGTPWHLYLPGPHRGVFNLDALATSKEVILCESLIDALTFWSAGFRNVTTSYGIEGFTREHEEAFEAYGIERLLIAYDRDEGGDRAAKALAEKLFARGIACFRVEFPRGMDANEFACKVLPADKSLDLVLRKAVWMGEGEPPEQKPLVPEAAKEEKDGPTPIDPETEGVASAEPSSLPLVARDSPAALVPTSPQPELSVEVKPQEVVLPVGDRRYRVRGLERNLSYDVLKVNLLASRREGFHVDTLDLYSARHRGQFVKQAAVELGVESKVVKRDLGRVLLALEELQDDQIQKALAPKEATPVELSETERREAMKLLRDPKLLERILADFESCGIVGEETNKLTGYLAAVSRKLDRPLAVIVQSSSAAGKSVLMEAILELVPPEEKVAYSAMTGQSLFYLGEADLRHKVLAIAEEEGAERASYALKLLQSEGELTIASTGKDPQTGRLITHEYRVEGPVAIFLTTTAIDVDEELLNRCLVLTVDEDREQTRAIHRRQRGERTLEGLVAGEDRRRILRCHQNAQRLLRPLPVVNPYAERLTFLDTQIRTRRDHEKYLALIDTIALLHQHQREVKQIERHGKALEYLEVELSDIETANRLTHEVLGRSLDELPPQTRRFLGVLDEMVRRVCEEQAIEREDFRFMRREICQATAWSYHQVRVHLDRLVELEYVLVHRGGRGQSFVYELVYDGQGEDGQPILAGLIDLATLRATTGGLGGLETSLGGEKEEFGGPLGGQWAPLGGSLGSGDQPVATGDSAESGAQPSKNTSRVEETPARSYTAAGAPLELFPLAARPAREG